jgi:hypothetical protein
MRCIAVHDDAGNIVSLVVGSDEGPRLIPVIDPGLHSREVELPDEVLDRLREAMREADESQASDVLRRWRVDIDTTPAQLVQRNRSTG